MTEDLKLSPQLITRENFKPYGQLILPSPDDKNYDENDAQLKLDRGIPRLYIMRLTNVGRRFHQITRHVECTQCLGALEGKEWFMAVAPPSTAEKPAREDVKVFVVPGNCFIKLAVGTWHSGPYFDHDFVDFYNLELSDTNISDHFTYNFLENENIEFVIA
jgi:ureidoglycolate hydrolase